MIPRNPWLTTNATFYYMQGFFFGLKEEVAPNVAVCFNSWQSLNPA